MGINSLIAYDDQYGDLAHYEGDQLKCVVIDTDPHAIEELLRGLGVGFLFKEVDLRKMPNVCFPKTKTKLKQLQGDGFAL